MKGHLLFIHNTLPEFRLCFFEELSRNYPTKFLITHPDLAQNIYGANGMDSTSIDVVYCNRGIFNTLKMIRKEISNDSTSKLILPPADSVSEIIEGMTSLLLAIYYQKDIYTWTEKWEAPKKEQSILKRIKNGLHAVILGTYTHFADKVIVFGSKAKEYMLGIGVPENKIVVSYMTSIPNKSIKKEDIRKTYHIPGEKKIIFNLARVIPRKGLDILIDSIEILKESHDDFVVLIGGDGPLLPTIIERVKERKLEDFVIFAGMIPTEKRADYYAQSDLFVLPSKYYKGMIDGWGLPVNESIYFLTPVVATNCEGSAFDLLNGENGVMVEQNDPVALKRGIEEMLYYKDSGKVRQACIETNEKFSLTNMVSTFINAIEDKT